MKNIILFSRIIMYAIIVVWVVFSAHLADAVGGGFSFDAPTSSQTFGELILHLARAITAIGIPVVSVMLVWAGFLFVTAGGNEEQLKKAKMAFKWGLVGGAIVIGAWAIATAIVNFSLDLIPPP
jgi:hypothetical protein